MNIAYSLNKEIPAEKIVKDIYNLCGKISRSDMVNSILVISIQKISQSVDTFIPKLEYQQKTPPEN